MGKSMPRVRLNCCADLRTRLNHSAMAARKADRLSMVFPALRRRAKRHGGAQVALGNPVFPTNLGTNVRVAH
jgi:hypothetical protein